VRSTGIRGRLFVVRQLLAEQNYDTKKFVAELRGRNVCLRCVCGVSAVCLRLDGIPLAIELAAARLSMLSVDQIAARLDQRFRLLTGGNRTAVRRQQPLEATIDWSYQLLSGEERSLVRRLAVFAGGWSPEAAEALGVDAVRAQDDVFELLSRLVAKSMVLVEEPREIEPRVVRYRFLESIREYAEEKLLASLEGPTMSSTSISLTGEPTTRRSSAASAGGRVRSRAFRSVAAPHCAAVQ
jgi:hypothetical protein